MNSKNVLESWTHDTKSNTARKLKNVGDKLNYLSLKKNKAKKNLSFEDVDRPQSINIGDGKMFDAIKFNSPMKNNRSYNLENIPSHLPTYEIPKNFKYKSQEDLPTYEDIIYDEHSLQRNTKLTQSMHAVQNNFNIRKDTNLQAIDSDSSDSDDHESLPPNIPVPELPKEGIYGKLRQGCVYENAPIVPLRKPPPPPVGKRIRPEANTSDESNRVTMCSTISESCTLTDVSDFTLTSRGIDRSESWRYVSTDDNISQATAESNESDEPIYANNENERMDSSQSVDLLQPAKILNTNNSRSGDRATLSREILSEFDPLSRESFDNYIMNTMNHMTLLETLLSEETYGTAADSTSYIDVDQVSVISSEDSNQIMNEQAAPLRSKSVSQEKLAPVPPRPERKKQTQRHDSVIIHQNLRLKDSIEDLVEPFLAKVEEPSTSSGPADISKPKATKTSWFVDNETSAEIFSKSNLDNPNNFTNTTSTDKVSKSVPQLSKVNNITKDSHMPHLPTYEESQNEKAEELEKASTPVKSRSTIFNFISFQGIMAQKDKPVKIDPKDFVPHPPFSEDTPSNAHDKGIILFKLPSGVIEDMLKELNPRFIELRKRQFKAYADPEMKVLKEHLDLTHLASVHYLLNHKFSDFKTECGRQIYCFEINLAVPKNSNNNNSLLDSKGSPVRTQRVTYVYGIHSKQEKYVQKSLLLTL